MDIIEKPQTCYAYRGIDDESELVFCARTRYGYTSLYRGLELHVGDHLYRKRGEKTAFLPDSYDYRYETLLKCMGIKTNREEVIGCYLGFYYDHDFDETIRFRISEDMPMDIVVIWKYSEDNLKMVKKMNPTAMNVAFCRSCIRAVFPIARIKEREEIEGPFDNYYDCEPDVVDLLPSGRPDFIMDGRLVEMSDEEITNERLCMCGFFF